MNTQKIKNLNLFTIRYPFTAIISILHRVSGVILFLIIPLLLWTLQMATSTSEEFSHIHSVFLYPWIRILLWLILVSFYYHLLAGIRHILMDIGLGESLKSGKVTGAIVVGLTTILAILTGIWLW